MKAILNGYGSHVTHNQMQIIIDALEAVNKNRDENNLERIDFEITDFFISE